MGSLTRDCEWDGCKSEAVYRCATCDLWTCDVHSEHGPVGDAPHAAVGSAVGDEERYRAALAHELSVLRESLHVKYCGNRAEPCPRREREMAMIKRIEGVLGDE